MATSTNSSSALKSPDQILLDGAETYAVKNAEYGDNFRLFPRVMVALFPEGITLRTYEDWMRMQFFLLKVVKLTRYTQNIDAGGHPDSIHDDMVYSAMLEAVDAEFNYARAHREPGEANGDKG